MFVGGDAAILNWKLTNQCGSALNFELNPDLKALKHPGITKRRDNQIPGIWSGPH